MTVADPKPPRLVSVDVLRGLVMLAMLFVNDIGAVAAVPWWLKHYKPDLANGMTVVDVVFPAFLFVVGLSIPLAFEARRRFGETATGTARHVLVRTAGLLVLGVVMVNFRGWGWWPILALLASIAAFVSVRGLSASGDFALRAAGLTALALLVASYGAFHPDQSFGTQWWGILGLIGWAYLVAGGVYLCVGASRAALAAGVAVLIGLFFADSHAPFGKFYDRIDVFGFKPTAYLDVGPVLGTHAAVTLAGALLGTCLLPGAPEKGVAGRARFALLLALGLALGAAVTYPSFGVNKNLATPAWGLASAAVTAVLWAAVSLITDTGRMPRWVLWLPAGVGANALLVYLLQPLWFRAWSMAGLSYGALAWDATSGLARGAAAALLLGGIAALLHHRGVRMRL